MTTLAAWSLGVALLAQQGQAEQERLQLARQRAAMLHALRQIAAFEIQEFSGPTPGDEGGHAHEVLLLVDRGLGTKHACKVPKEWLER